MSVLNYTLSQHKEAIDKYKELTKFNDVYALVVLVNAGGFVICVKREARNHNGEALTKYDIDGFYTGFKQMIEGGLVKL